MSVVIDKGIPMPDRPFGRAGNRGRSKWPWHDMEVGDSFVMPNAKHSNASSHASIVGKKNGHKYRSAKVEGGIRIWRVA